MAEGKKSFILYADLLPAVKKMPDDKAGQLFKIILSYVNDENPKTDDLLVDVLFEQVKQQLKRDLIRYEEVKVNKSNGGRLGNLKRWNKDLYEDVTKNKLTLDEAEIIATNRRLSHTDSMPSVPIAQIAVNDNVNVNVNDNVINNIKYNHQLIAKAEAFDIFWNAYNKKTDKAKSEIKFMKLPNKEIETILKVVNSYVLRTPDIKYRKSPLTWLNGKNWNDEIETDSNTSNQVYKPNNNLGTSNQIKKYND